ncbi:hypothetical protein ACQKL5_17265 [Peribacillus sp. NPDC097675]|uniref:hypothetical protein n=1 Tax=Peribacillus sp. NPDC097675 TaxID=3390618 RepID=UPI003CFED903
MKPIAYISTDIQFTRLKDIDRENGLVFLQLYDIPFADFSAYAGVIVTNFVEEAFLLEHKEIIENYLNAGGVILSQTENFLPWLPGCGNWMRSPISLKDREIRLTEPVHPMFAGIDPYDLNYKKGVRGFFSRGYLEAPDHSEIIVEDQEGKAIIYIDRKTTGGTIVAGAGTDLYRFGIEENSSRVLRQQILTWIREEYEANKGETKQ